MEKMKSSLDISEEDFKKLYDNFNGFIPSTSENSPVLEESFFKSLEEGCDLLIKHRPDLVNYSLEDDLLTI